VINNVLIVMWNQMWL